MEYCEYANLKNITAKYECIDSLNVLNAYDDASEACLIAAGDEDLRKEATVCTIYKAADLVRENNDVRMKGADYCYF